MKDKPSIKSLLWQEGVRCGPQPSPIQKSGIMKTEQLPRGTGEATRKFDEEKMGSSLLR